MKRLPAFLYLLMVALFLFGCARSDSYAAYLPASGDSVPEFTALLKQSGLCAQADQPCYNVTPDSVQKQTDCLIFKFPDSCASFALLGDKIFQLGEYFGGMGLSDAEPFDPDGDGKPGLIYTYSWGSGMHHTMASYLNLDTGEETLLYSALDIREMVLVKSGEGLKLCEGIAEPVPGMEQAQPGWLGYGYKEGAHLADISARDGEIIFTEIKK